MKYLIEDRDALYKAVGDDIKRLIDNAECILREEGPDGLQRYENRLLREFYFLKTRIDIIDTEDIRSEDELLRLRYRLSALNEALLYLMKLAPNGALAKEFYKNNN